MTSPIVVIASGTAPGPLRDFRSEGETDRRIFTEVYPLRRARGRRIAVVGCGDAAFDYGLSLSAANSVVIYGGGRRSKGLPLLRDRAAEHPRLSYWPDAALRTIRRNGRGLELILARADGTQTVAADYLVAAVGRKPCLDFMSAGLRTKARDLIRNRRLDMIGDVKNGLFRQTAIGVGDGVRAAMDIFQAASK